MITDPYYWLALLILVLVVRALPANYRFFIVGSSSFAFIIYLLYSTLPASESNRISGLDWLTHEHFRVIYFLIIFSLLFYHLPKLHEKYGISFKRTQFILICSVLLYLAYHKYIPVFLQYVAGGILDSAILIPLGISYFSFKLIHYSIELGRNNLKAHTFTQFFTYIFLFPIYTAGPIERFDHFQNHWDKNDRKADIIEGCTRIVYGLIKKFVISGMILLPLLSNNSAESILGRIETIEVYKVWGFLAINYLLIYLDFSAYSDIAIGSARLLGFRIMENFNWPIFATNISMLWKRWHMTLSGWCQSYVYMPTIGLTRNPYLAVVLTFLAVGLWHGGAYSWIAWGLYQGVGVLIFIIWSKQKMKRKIRIPSNVATKSVAILLTNSWMAGSFAFTVTLTDGSFDNVTNALRLLGRCLFI